jgi:hypothetical protein
MPLNNEGRELARESVSESRRATRLADLLITSELLSNRRSGPRPLYLTAVSVRRGTDSVEGVQNSVEFGASSG